MSLFDSSRAGGNSRRLLIVVVLVAIGGNLQAQDRLLRSVAFTEALFPAAVVIGNGLEDPLDAAFLGGSLALHTAPNILLFIAESSGRADLTRTARLVSAVSGFATSAAGLAIGIPLLLGAFPSWNLEPYAGWLIAVSIPTGFAAAVDLVPYNVESRLE